MIESQTRTVTIEATAEQLFTFVSDLENLPRWAFHYCHGLRRDDTRWIVTTPDGDVAAWAETDAQRGTIDFFASPAPGVVGVVHTRVVPLGTRAVYTFTIHPTPGMSADQFAQQVHGLEEELDALKRVVEAGAPSPADAEAA